VAFSPTRLIQSLEVRVDTFPALIERRLSAAIELLKLQPFHLAPPPASDG